MHHVNEINFLSPINQVHLICYSPRSLFYSLLSLYPFTGCVSNSSKMPSGIETVPEPSAFESTSKLDKPSVLIVGAGIGGITLDILLKKAGVKFQSLSLRRW